jgi:hypothetical protein
MALPLLVVRVLVWLVVVCLGKLALPTFLGKRALPLGPSCWSRSGRSLVRLVPTGL